MSKIKAKKREFWADALRTLSIFLVVVIHTSAKVLYEWGSVSELAWNFANLLDSISRISVPIFVMLSGAFLLNKKESLQKFLSTRIPRIMLPWFFWGTIQLFYNYDFSINKIFASNFANKLAETFFGGFWYMPVILGLYLITPIVREFVQKAKTKEFLYFFILWFCIASLVPTLNQTFGKNISYQLPTFIKYLGYFVAGYFITHKFKINEKTLNQTGLLYLVSTVVISLGTYALTKINSEFHSSLYEYSNVPVFIASITGFITLKTVFENKKLKISKFIKEKITKISKASLGIFLSHALILEIFANGVIGVKIHALSITPILAIPAVALLVFSTSTVVVFLLQRFIPKLAS